MKIKKIPTRKKAVPPHSLKVAPEGWSMEKQGLTQSMIALFALCPQKAAYSLLEGIKRESKFDAALDFGNFFHDSLDKVYTAVSMSSLEAAKPDNLKLIVDRVYLDSKKRMQTNGVDTKSLQDFEVVYGMCRVVLEQYFRKWEKEDSKINWIDLERVFSVPYTLRDRTRIQLRGKFDGVFRDGKGKLWLFETKTKSSIGRDTIMETVEFNLQVMLYMRAMKEVYGEQPAGVLYNLVKRPGQQFNGTYNKKPESLPQYLERIKADIEKKPEDYFNRYSIAIAFSEVEKYFDTDFDYIVQRMYEWQQGGYANFRNSAACSMWNRPCEYLPICSTGDRTMYTRKLTMFPELEGAE